MDCQYCQNCPNEGIYQLENNKGDKFKLKIEDKKNFVYNSIPTILGYSLEHLPYINKFRINLTDEKPEEINQLIKDLKNSKLQKEGNYIGGVN